VTNRGNRPRQLDLRHTAAITYGLGIRLGQAKQIADFPWARGPDYLDDLSHDSVVNGRKPLDEDCFWLLGKWLTRISSLTLEFEQTLASSGRKPHEVEAAATLREAVDSLVAIKPQTMKVEDPGRGEHLRVQKLQDCKFNTALRQARELFGSAIEKAKNLVAVLATSRREPLWPDWFELGQVITLILDERDDSALQDVEPDEPWQGIFALEWTDLPKAELTLEVPDRVNSLINKLGGTISSLLPAIDQTCPVQQEIMASEILPDIFPSWFQVEAGYWPLVYPKVASSSCLDRDLCWCQWEEEMLSNVKNINAAIRDRWNELTEAERRSISPGCIQKVELQTVKKVLEKKASLLARNARRFARNF
jgi:hypothetical protein